MKTKTLFLLIIAWFLIFGANCKKDIPYYQIPQEFKDYIIFPEGSYWIYIDSVNTFVDSVNLIQQTFIYRESSYPGASGKYEYYFDSFYQKYYCSFENGFVHKCGEFDILVGNINTYVYGQAGLLGMYILFMHPFIEGGTSDVDYEFMDFFQINNITYHNIKIFTNYKEYNNKKYERVYYCKNIGIIKRKIITTDNDSIVWEIKEYHINN